LMEPKSTSRMKKNKPTIALVTPYGTENNGVRILAAVLMEMGLSPHTIFFKDWRNNNVIAPTRAEIAKLCGYLKKIEADIVGIGFGTPYLRLIENIAEEIRLATGAKILVGGIHPTIAPEDCVAWADAVAVGEGEPIIQQIAKRSIDGRDWSGIPGLFQRGDTGPYTPASDFVDLDALPCRDFSSHNKVLIENGNIIRGDPLTRLGVIRVHASRGCPYACAYCYEASLAQIYGRRFAFRRRTVESVIGEIQEARRHFKRFRRIKFDDDTFIHPKSWLTEFCERWPKEIGTPFDILLNPEAFKTDDIERLAKAGLKHVQMGIEAASEEESEIYNRKDNRQKIIQFGLLASRLGLEVNYDIIIDNPLATEKDKRATFELLMELPQPYRIFLYSLNVFPKSGVFDSLTQGGHMTENEIEGRAQKSFRQFRASFDWPRPPEDRYYMALMALASKPFIPKWKLRWLASIPALKKHPGILVASARVADALRLAWIGIGKLISGELSFAKFREYASIRRLPTQ